MLHINNTDARDRQLYGKGYAYINRHRGIAADSIWENVVVNDKQTTKHAVCETQLDRQVEKKAYSRDTNSQRQANRQGMQGMCPKP